jgi:ketosteroid isomerase-like protein
VRTATNREVVERAYAGGEDDFLAALHPDAEWHCPRGVADAEVCRGAGDIRRALDLWTESWTDFSMDLEELHERGETLLAIVRYRALGRGCSGTPRR